LEAFTGLNVTIPHKQAIMASLDQIDPLAEKSGLSTPLLACPGNR